MAGCSTHVPKPLGRHGHRVLNVWWTVPPAWLSQQSADDVKCRRRMSGAGSQQGTPALFHEDSGRPEHTLWEVQGQLALTVLEGIMEGLRHQGRPRRQWIQDIEEWTGCEYIQLKEMSKDRAQWRRKISEWSSAVAKPHRGRSTSE